MKIQTDPPVQLMPGYGFTTRLYDAGRGSRELARKHLRRRYNEGVQMAFCYYESDKAILGGLVRLRRVLQEE